MSFRNTVVVFAVILGSLSTLTSCFAKEVTMEEQEEMMTDMAYILLDQVASKDSESFSNMFSSDALSTEDFEEGLEHTLDLFNGGNCTITKTSVSEYGAYYGLAKSELWNVTCRIETDDGNFKLHFQYYVHDHYSSILLREFGVNAGKIKTFILIEDVEGVRPYWQGYHVYRSGIYTPAWDDQPR